MIAGPHPIALSKAAAGKKRKVAHALPPWGYQRHFAPAASFIIPKFPYGPIDFSSRLGNLRPIRIAMGCLVAGQIAIEKMKE
jgi:hypothetical protein